MDDRKKNLELDKICRVCLVQKKDMRPIFGEMIADMLMECANIKIESTDGWPDKICIQCIHSVSRCHAFKTLVEKSDKELRNYIKSLTIVIQEPVLDMDHHQPSSPQLTRHHHVKEIVEPTSIHQAQSRQVQTATLPQQIVLSNGQVINTAQIVTTTHGGQQIAQIVNAGQLGQLLQSGSTVQMIQPNGQPGQVVQIQRTLDDGCEIIVQPDLSDETQYFEDVTITEHDDIETTEDIIHIQDDDDIEEMFEEDDTEECITIPEELTYSMEGVSEEEEEEESDDKEYLAEFINAQVSTPAPGRYVCNLCRKEFKQYKWMENHMKSHSNWIKANCKKQPQCDICHRSFKGPGMLRMHMKTHETSEKVPTCTICNKQFKSKTILYRHRQIHQMKTYSCGNCTKAFSSPFTLNSHMTKKHSNEQHRFKCAECFLVFNALDALKDHVQITGHSVKNNRNDDESS